MAQQQYQMQHPPQAVPRPFSPAQKSSASPDAAPFAFPSSNVQHQPYSPGPNAQPYNQSPYAASPGAPLPLVNSPIHNELMLASNTPSNASPQLSNNISLPDGTPARTATPSHSPMPNNHIQVPANPMGYSGPYSNNTNGTNQQNGHLTPQPSHQNSPAPHLPNGVQYNHNQFQTSFSNMHPQTPVAGTMGPPLKPLERDNVNDDQTDVLANAGVDLRAEENYAMSFYTGSYNSQPTFSQGSAVSGGHGFTQFAPANGASFYGAGPANQPGQAADAASQDALEKKAADQAWADAARHLAQSREHELKNPHVQVQFLWRRMDKIARDHGLALNTDPGNKMPVLKLASEFRSDVNVQTAAGQFGAMTATGGRFLPADTALADQLALMSLATNQRIRTLLEDAVAITRGRRMGSDGTVPAEWADAAVPAQGSNASIVQEDGIKNGWESSVSPRLNPRKRSLTSANGLPTPASTPAEGLKFKSEVSQALRDVAVADREFEERRIQKRLDRANGGPSRLGSATPGTPSNSAAPEPGSAKQMTKKERDKVEKERQSNINTHAQANSTMDIMFGKSKKQKYSWMTAGGGGGGGGGSGATTPGRIMTQGIPGTPGGLGGGAPEVIKHTPDGPKFGGFREAGQTKVELRDWIMAMEGDNKELKALQQAYTMYGKK